MEAISLNRDVETYFHLMNSFLLVQVAELDETLKENGITEPKTREDICAQFGLRMGQVLDWGWIGSNAKRYFPLLMFAERFLDGPNTALSTLGVIEAPPKTDEFHPLAVDAATVFFRDLGGDAAKVEYGGPGDA